MGLAFLVLLALAALAAIGFFLYGLFLGVLLLFRLSARGYARLTGTESDATVATQMPDLFAPFRRKGPNADRPLYCWEEKECPAERRASCPAYGVKEIPCWLARIRAIRNIVIPPDCLGCTRFSILEVLEHV